MISQGNFPLTGTEGLPHVSVAFPGEHWSNRKASGAVLPGSCVVPVNDPAGSASVNTPGNSLKMRVAGAADVIAQAAIALRTVQVPDQNTGPGGQGPNEIMNKEIQNGEYVHAYYSGAFHLTLVTPRNDYVAGMLIGWDADGARPAHIPGVGAWAPNAQADIDSFFEVLEVRPVGSNNEVILTVRSLRGQF